MEKFKRNWREYRVIVRVTLGAVLLAGSVISITNQAAHSQGAPQVSVPEPGTKSKAEAKRHKVAAEIPQEGSGKPEEFPGTGRVASAPAMPATSADWVGLVVGGLAISFAGLLIHRFFRLV